MFALTKCFRNKSGNRRNFLILFHRVFSSEENLNFKIFSFDSFTDKEPKMKDFQLRKKLCGKTVLDALNMIKSTLDSSLSFRNNCSEHIIGTCAMNINGTNRLACQTPINSLEENIILKPLPDMMLMKDLKVDISKLILKYKYEKPYFTRISESDEQKEKKKEFLKVFSKFQNKDDIENTNKSSTLYLNKVPRYISEQKLFDMFSKCAKVKSVECIHDPEFKYFNFVHVRFYNEEDAMKAYKTFNFMKINDKDILIHFSRNKIHYSFEDKRKIKVTNMDESIDKRTLFEAFSKFGGVYNCRVLFDFIGRSRGKGFITFEKFESAQKAIEKVNNLKVGDKTLKATFLTDKEKKDGFTTVIIKNVKLKDFPTEDALGDFLEKFGEVKNMFLLRNSDGGRIGSALVEFKDPKDAFNLTTKELKKGNTFLRAQRYIYSYKKVTEIKKFFENDENASKKLLVFNLPPLTDTKALKEKFSNFGEIEHAKVFYNKKNASLRSGMVVFANKMDSIKAKISLNVNSSERKPLCVRMIQ